MDRASGSGVFARDPDAQLDMIELEMTDEMRKNSVSGATAWRMEGCLREFRDFEPVHFWFEYPLHRVDKSGKLVHLEAVGNGPDEKHSGRPSQKMENVEKLRQAFEIVNLDRNGAKLMDLARACNKSDRTIRDWICQANGEFILDRGTVRRMECFSL